MYLPIDVYEVSEPGPGASTTGINCISYHKTGSVNGQAGGVYFSMYAPTLHLLMQEEVVGTFPEAMIYRLIAIGRNPEKVEEILAEIKNK